MNFSLKFTAARISISLLFLIVTMLQIVSFPGQFSHMHHKTALQLSFEITLLVLIVLWLLCAQIALASLWKIVSLMQLDTFFSKDSITWINRVLSCCAGALVIALTLFALIASQSEDPGFLVLLTAVTLFIATLYIFVRLLRDQVAQKASQ